MVTAGIKSFMCPDAILLTLKALEANDFAEVIVADDSVIDQEKSDIYERLKKKIGCFQLIELPYDVGVTT
jgi:hypothetical protein